MAKKPSKKKLKNSYMILIEHYCGIEKENLKRLPLRTLDAIYQGVFTREEIDLLIENSKQKFAHRFALGGVLAALGVTAVGLVAGFLTGLPALLGGVIGLIPTGIGGVILGNATIDYEHKDDNVVASLSARLKREQELEQKREEEQYIFPSLFAKTAEKIEQRHKEKSVKQKAQEDLEFSSLKETSAAHEEDVIKRDPAKDIKSTKTSSARTSTPRAKTKEDADSENDSSQELK